MGNDDTPVEHKLTRRKALGAFGAAGAAMLAACASPTVQAQLPTPVAPTATAPAPATATNAAAVPTSASAAPSATATTPCAPSAPFLNGTLINYNSKTLEHYYDEWLSLRDVLRELEKRYSRNPATPPRLDFARQNDILHIIRSLQQFGQGQFNFFYKGFSPGGRGASLFPELKPSSDFTPQEVLATTLAQISEDVATLQQVAEQRLWDFTLPGNLTVSGLTVSQFLQKTDSLAASALWPGPESITNHTAWPLWLSLSNIPSDGEGVPDGTPKADYGGDFEIKTVLTYFKKSVDVRVIPYARVALVGIPFGTLYHPQHLLSIPHEVGHFLYWYSHPGVLASNSAFYVNVRELSGKWQSPGTGGLENWRPEIFADIYAVLRAGPLAVLAAMDMAMEHSAFDFSDFSGDEEHPTPKIRPLIQIKALYNFSDKVSAIPQSEREQVATGLLNEWRTRLYNERALKLTDPDVLPVTSDDIKLDLSKPLDIMIGELLNVFDTAIMSDPVSGIHRLIEQRLGWGWSKPIWDGSDLVTDPAQYLADAETFSQYYRGIEYFTLKRTDHQFLPSFDAPSSWSPPDDNESVIPPLWREWVVNAKQYVEDTNLKASGTLSSGIFPGEMDPKANPFPINNWIRIFGSGGWTTEGPCTSRR